MAAILVFLLISGPYDKYSHLITIDFNVYNKQTSYRQGFEGRSFYIKVKGRPYKNFVDSNIPKWLGVWRIMPLTGPSFEFELIFPDPYYEIKIKRSKNRLSVTFGKLRAEYIAVSIAEIFLSQSLPLPEAKLMKPFPRIERLIAAKKYREAERLLEDLPIGFGNGLRGLRLGDIQLYQGKIATAVRSYEGVVRRFGNLYFAALTRTRLIAVKAVVYNQFPTLKSLDGTLKSIKPYKLQKLARRKVALAYEGVNKLTTALHILKPLKDEVRKIRERIFASLIKYNLVAGNLGLVVLYYKRYKDILFNHPKRLLLDLYISEAFLALNLSKNVIPILEKELRSIGKWKKGDPLAERGFAYLSEAFCLSGNWIKCEGSTRYYLENRKKGAPHEGKMWEWYANSLRHKGVFEKAHVFYRAAIRSYWDKQQGVSLGLRLAREFIKKNPKWSLDYINDILKLNPSEKQKEQAVLLAYNALDSLSRINEAPLYFAYLKKPSPMVLVRHSEILARLGDVGRELFFLEVASTMEGPWAKLAEARLTYLKEKGREKATFGKKSALSNARR